MFVRAKLFASFQSMSPVTLIHLTHNGSCVHSKLHTFSSWRHRLCRVKKAFRMTAHAVGVLGRCFVQGQEPLIVPRKVLGAFAMPIP